MNNPTILTYILLGFTILISYRAFSDQRIMQKLCFHPVSIKQGNDYIRFLSYGFLHANMEHLLINMFVLWQFGGFIESYFSLLFGKILGGALFLVLYFVGIIVSTIPSYFKHQHDSGYVAVGASGATSALVFATIFFRPWDWLIFPPLPFILFGVAYLWYSSYMEKRGMDNIGHNAHFWGAVFGFTYTFVAVVAFRPEALTIFFSQLVQGPSLPAFLQ